VIIKGVRPKWYSSNIQFFHNNKTYELKKKGFWGTTFAILEGERQIGDIKLNLKTVNTITLRDNNSSLQYGLETERAGKWYASNRKYLLYQNGETQILTIHYALKKWKESLSAEFNDKSNANYILLIFALFLMRHEQNSESSAANI
jgi:hypothetical protein